jgi:hypothetical protein
LQHINLMCLILPLTTRYIAQLNYKMSCKALVTFCVSFALDSAYPGRPVLLHPLNFNMLVMIWGGLIQLSPMKLMEAISQNIKHQAAH